MPYQQHLQRLDSAEAAQQQRMAALSQPLTLDLPQQLANIRRKGIGIGGGWTGKRIADINPI